MDPDINFECVLPMESHAKLIMEWRNDPETLKMSFHQQPKKWDLFYREFLEDYFSFPELPPLFALVDGKRAAFLRFKPVINPSGTYRNCAEISINVAPMFRGKGIGQAVLKAIQKWLPSQGFPDLYAEVKKENKASRNAFEKAGFIRLLDTIKKIEETEESVEICRYFLDAIPDTGEEKPVFIIAEAGSNWRMGTFERDLAMAKTMIDAAADAGVDAVKFQTFRPETIYAPNAGMSDYLAESGIRMEMKEIFTDLAMPYEMLPELADYCRKNQVQFMSTPFSSDDFMAVDPFVNIHKIASYEINHIHLLELAARSKKPLILSTGAATEEEIGWAVKLFRQMGGEALTLLQCTAKYPAEATSLHLNAIPWMQKRFKVNAGLSDHSRHPVEAPVAAVALGAKVIEKHFTLSNLLPGPDHQFAVTPEELKVMVKAIRLTEKMLGARIKMIDPSEEELRNFAKRGIQAIADIKKGEALSEGENIAILRPGKQIKGVSPRLIYNIEGKIAQRLISIGEGIQPGDWLE